MIWDFLHKRESNRKPLAEIPCVPYRFEVDTEDIGVLVSGGWTKEQAVRALEKNSFESFLVADDGDDWTIEITQN